jgi:hypothetical protein
MEFRSCSSVAHVACHVAGVALLIACAGSPSSTGAASACAPHIVASDDWPIDGGSRFSVRLPPGYTRQPLKGLDSEVGHWVSASGEVSYDYGAYSDTLGRAIQTSGIACNVIIGARAARIVVFRDERGRYAFGAHWRNIEQTGLGAASLTLSGFARDSLSRDSLLASAWSLVFRSR